MKPLAYVMFTCRRDQDLMACALEAARAVSPAGSTFSVYNDVADPVPDAFFEELAFDGLTVERSDNGHRPLRGERFVGELLQRFWQVCERNPDAAYVAKLDSDTLLLRDGTARIRASERFKALGTMRVPHAPFGAHYFLHRSAARELSRIGYVGVCRSIQPHLLAHGDELREDEFIGKAVWALFGDDQICYRDPEPWVEGWFDVFHFDGRDGELADERAGRFFDAVEFGQVHELPADLDDEEVAAEQLRAMRRVWNKHRRGAWSPWPRPALSSRDAGPPAADAPASTPTPVAFVMATCGRDAPLLPISLRAARETAPAGSTFTLFNSQEDPVDQAVLDEVGFDELYVESGSNVINTPAFVRLSLDRFVRVLERSPHCAYVGKLDTDTLILHDGAAHLRDVERFMSLGTGGAWGLFGACYFVHRHAVEVMAALPFDALLEIVRYRFGLAKEDGQMQDDEVIPKAVAALFGPDRVYHRAGGGVEGWFEMYRFSAGVESLEDERTGQFFDVVEFGRRDELDPGLSPASRALAQAEVMERVWAKHERSTWLRWS